MLEKYEQIGLAKMYCEDFFDFMCMANWERCNGCAKAIQQRDYFWEHSKEIGLKGRDLL